MDNRINFKLPLIKNFESAFEICKTFLESSPENEASNIKIFRETRLKDEGNIISILKKEYEQRKQKAGDSGKEYVIDLMQSTAYSIIDFNIMKFNLIPIIKEINHLQLVDEETNFSKAFEIYSKKMNKKEKTKLFISLSIDRGFREFIEYLNEEIESISAEEQNIEIIQFEKINSKEFTTARQVLAMHYIFEALKVPQKRTLSAKARLCKMLTDKNVDRIKDSLENPLEQKRLIGQDGDLVFVKKYFLDLGLENIVNAINSDLTSLSSN